MTTNRSQDNLERYVYHKFGRIEQDLAKLWDQVYSQKDGDSGAEKLIDQFASDSKETLNNFKLFQNSIQRKVDHLQDVLEKQKVQMDVEFIIQKNQVNARIEKVEKYIENLQEELMNKISGRKTSAPTDTAQVRDLENPAEAKHHKDAKPTTPSQKPWDSLQDWKDGLSNLWSQQVKEWKDWDYQPFSGSLSQKDDDSVWTDLTSGAMKDDDGVEWT